MTTQADDFLDALKALLIDGTAGVPELEDANVCVWHHGESDPDEDVKAAASKCKGVSVLIYDLGGEVDPDGPATAVIDHEAAIELYVSTPKRNRRKDPTLRMAGGIRDAIMRCIHRSASLRGTQQHFFDTRVIRWKPLQDGEFTAYQITASRPISLE